MGRVTTYTPDHARPAGTVRSSTGGRDLAISTLTGDRALAATGAVAGFVGRSVAAPCSWRHRRRSATPGSAVSDRRTRTGRGHCRTRPRGTRTRRSRLSLPGPGSHTCRCCCTCSGYTDTRGTLLRWMPYGIIVLTELVSVARCHTPSSFRPYTGVSLSTPEGRTFRRGGPRSGLRCPATARRRR